ncbi:flavin reductase family protein [Tomitella fengzijianii]|uniref:Flavin reductase family protein n=2 Tax=Tomitella fengzijianii TaxID=2597660 RepID=A0A516X8U4_9ACTN|nr:flavin reductase family protein [Tomitella fengzijianii]
MARPAPDAEVDPRTLRAVLGNFCTGVTVITAHDGRRPLGFACQSVTSLSLDPPYVSFCPAKTSTSWPAMRAVESVCINVLAADQKEVCGRFAVSGGDKFEGLPWFRGDNGAPVVSGALARIEAELAFEHEAGDHTIAVCRVTALEAARDVDPLLFFRGGYGSFADM